MFQRHEEAGPARGGVDGAEQGDQRDQGEAFGGRVADPGGRHQRGTAEQHRSHREAPAIDPDGERHGRRAEQRERRQHADLGRAVAQRDQVRGQQHGRRAIAEVAQATRAKDRGHRHARCALARFEARAGDAHDVAPHRALARRALGSRGRRGPEAARAGAQEAVLHGGVFVDLLHGRVQALDDRRLNARRRCHRAPAGDDEIRYAGFGHGGDVRQRRPALGAGHGQRAHLAPRDCGNVAREIVEREIHIAREHRGDGLRGAAERDVRALDLKSAGEHRTRQMRRGADAGRAIGHAVRLGPRPGDEFRHGARGRVRRGHREDVRQLPMHRDRLDVALGVVGQAGVEVLVDRPATHGDGADGVAIRRAFRDGVMADIATRARPVLYNEGLAELLAQLFTQQPAQHIGGPTRRPGHDHADRPLRIGALGAGEARGEGRQRQGCGEKGAARWLHEWRLLRKHAG